MYFDKNMQRSLEKVEAARQANIQLNPRRMTAEEKQVLLKTYHPDYRENQFDNLTIGPNPGPSRVMFIFIALDFLSQ